MIFRQRREDLWLGKIAMVIVAAFFVLGSFLAWFSWTQIARPKVFHVLTYNPFACWRRSADGPVRRNAVRATARGGLRRALPHRLRGGSGL